MDQQHNTPEMNPFNANEVVVALDIGTTKVTALAGKFNDYGQIEIIGFSNVFNVGVQQGEIFNLLKTSETVKQAIRDLEMKIGMKVKGVVSGLSGKHIRTFKTHENIIRENPDEMILESDVERLHKRAKEAIALEENEEVIGIFPQYYKVDTHAKVPNPVGMIGKRLEGDFLVVIANKKKIALLYKSMLDAGIEPVDLFLQSMASAEATLTPAHKEAGVVLVDIGGGTTDILIYKEGRVRYTGVIPYGGDTVTEEIKNTFQLLPRAAEKLKIKEGHAYANSVSDEITIQLEMEWDRSVRYIKAKTLAHVIQTKMDMIASKIMEAINEYKQNFPGETINAGLVVTGGGSQMGSLRQFLELKTGLTTNIVGPSRHITTIKGWGKQINEPKYSTLVGLLILGLNDLKKNGPRFQYLTTDRETPETKVESQSGTITETVEEPDLFIPPETEQEKKPATKKRLGGFLYRIEDFFKRMINNENEEDEEKDENEDDENTDNE